jgi:hypothetical protein
MSHHAALQRANQQVAEQEQIIAEWAELIGRMNADGRDVTLAMELFGVFRTHLATYRSNRDRLQRAGLRYDGSPVAEGRARVERSEWLVHDRDHDEQHHRERREAQHAK